MGHSLYDVASYTAATETMHRTGEERFSYSARLMSSAAATGDRSLIKVHEKLDPRRPNRSGQIIRESLDSQDHPTAKPVSIWWDVTGSMGHTPRVFAEKMDRLMNLLLAKQWLPHPHIMFGAVGDAKCDAAPIQVGQFEASNEMDDVLRNIIIEGGGGSGLNESYELAWYYMARHTKLDEVEKNRGKGYLFMLGDELPYARVSRDEVKKWFNDDLQDDILTSSKHPYMDRRPVSYKDCTGDILEELKTKFDVFWMIPQGSQGWHRKEVREGMKAMFGQNLILLADPADCCEVIAATIGLREGHDAVMTHLREATDSATYARVSETVRTFEEV